MTEYGAEIVLNRPAFARKRNNFVANHTNAFLDLQNALGYAEADHRVWSTEALKRKTLEELVRLQKLPAARAVEA